MASKVEIGNRSLSKVGEARMTALTDNSKPAREINAAFDMVRDAELRKYRWSFAKRRAVLAALVAAPAFGFSYEFTLPTDCLRVLSVGDFSPGVDISNARNADAQAYVIESRSILTDDAGPLNLVYTASIEDTASWDACFVETFAARLAFDVADALTASQSRKDALFQEYKDSLRDARRANAIELPPSPIADDTWILARGQG